MRVWGGCEGLGDGMGLVRLRYVEWSWDGLWGVGGSGRMGGLGGVVWFFGGVKTVRIDVTINA